MKYNPDIHHRHSIRLKNYDYSSNGLYYITICTQNRAMLFGEIVGQDVGADSISALDTQNSLDSQFAQMHLNDAGEMVENLYRETIRQFKNVIDAKHVIMPNHFHGIIAMDRSKPRTSTTRADMESAPTLSAIIQAFKRYTTIKYVDGVKDGRFTPFNKRIWQRNYYERIIRDETEYLRIWQYIDENPARWEEDKCFG